MTVATIFETCQPRADVLAGSLADADFAADLAQVVSATGNAEYTDPARFFATTYPTRGLRELLANVCRRLTGAGGELAAIFRLDTTYGGGKTHGLIALVHAGRGMAGVTDVSEFVAPALVPKAPVRIAAFDGENADPANGRAMGDGVLAYTPWGEIACALAGKAGYQRIRESDRRGIAPGAETIAELFGGEPVLILLDELAVYLRKLRRIDPAGGGGQLTAFLTALFKAVNNAPNAALVYTLAIGKDGAASDAYGDEHSFIADCMAEAESVSSRKATLLDPTGEDETVQVLSHRLFETIDATGAEPALAAYRALWAANRESLAADAARPETADVFRSGYPFHPDVLETLTAKTATLANFQRVRGMLRLLAATIAHLWQQQPADATAIHLHHIDPGNERIRQEIVTRLGQQPYVPAISNDVAGLAGKPALAQQLDAHHHTGMAPYAAYLARTVFMHSLAFNEPLKGIAPTQLRYSLLSPAMDIGFIDEARRKFVADSAYLDDRPGAPLRFLVEANLTQIVHREERNVDPDEARAELKDRIRHIFEGKMFEAVPFPGGPFDVVEFGDGRPKLVVLAYDGVTVGDRVETVPELVRHIFSRRGSEGSALRMLRNDLVFVVADEDRKQDMRRKARRRLALRELKKPERLSELAEHQQDKLREWEARSEQELALAIQQCYRHVFYPSRDRIGAVDLAHSAIDTHSTSDRPGIGQKQIWQALHDLGKLRDSSDEPDSPAYIRDRTPLKKGEIATRVLREEFRRNPALPILIGDDIFIRGIRRGVEQSEYVYRSGDLLFGPGDPPAAIEIDEQSFVFTMAYARNTGIWPRPQPDGEQPPDEDPPIGGDDVNDGDGQPPIGGEPPAGAFTAEGILKEALIQLWEQARAAKVEHIATLAIRMFEAGDAFRLLGAIGAVAGATKVVFIEGGYESRDGASFWLRFEGPVPDAQPLREFLEPQLRAAAERDLQARFELAFADGLAMKGEAPEKLTERLAKFAGGAAHVSATATPR